MSSPAMPKVLPKFSTETILIAGCLIAVLTFGPRSAVGQFQLPILSETHWSTAEFSLAIAFQNLLWGVGQPFSGALADRFGSMRVLIMGALFYAAGLALMAYSTTPLMFDLSAGGLVGFGLSGCSFNIVLGAFGKLIPEKQRSMAYGFGTAAGSLGQFLFSPLTGGLLRSFEWQTVTLVLAALMLLVVPLAIFVSSPAQAKSVDTVSQQSVKQALVEAFGHRSYVLLVIGFFTCGFQLAFVTVHFQRYVVEAGLNASVGYWAFGLVGIFNIVGSLTSGWAGSRMPRRWILSFIYISRSLVTLAFILLPISTYSAYAFGALTGLLWLSTVPPTSSLIGMMFGPRHFAMLYGFAFFSHQVGGFLGVLLGGILREQSGSYTIVWWLSIALGVASALINLPIVERPVLRDLAPVSA